MLDDLVEVLIPTSPIPSHPSTAIIQETIDSVRYHFPDSNILVLVDGVRAEQADFRKNYYQYVTALYGLVRKEFPANVSFYTTHHHQVGMLRHVMHSVQTPYLLFLEHDCPLVQRPIDWYAIDKVLIDGTVDFVRFLPEPQIHPEHEYLMGEEIAAHGIRLRKTVQFSARPHIATRSFYQRLLSRFSPEARCFIEDAAHSWCQAEPWENWKMSVYLDPEGKDSKFSYHLDGRDGARKFDETQVF